MTNYKKKIVCLVVLHCLAMNADAETALKSLRTDSRAKVVNYNPIEIYRLKTTYLNSTDIILKEGEVVTENDYHLGDASAWDVQAYRNHIYIKAKKINAAGNLNINTDKHTYHFVLSVLEPEKVDKDETLFLEFKYPHEPKSGSELIHQINLPANVCADSNKFNTKYSFTGDREQAPLVACDDGTFTYLKFRRQVDLPAIFLVLPDRTETVVNYRIEGDYMVIERVGKSFTLRNGKTVTSIYNDLYIGDWTSVRKN